MQMQSAADRSTAGRSETGRITTAGNSKEQETARYRMPVWSGQPMAAAVFVAGAFHCSSSQHPRSRRHREEGELRKQARPELSSQVNGGRSTPTMAGTGRGVSSALRAGVACRLGSWTGRPRRHMPLSTILPGGEGREWACRKSAHCANVQAIQAFRDHVRCFSLASARNCLVLHFPLCILLDVTPHSFVRRYTLSRFLDILAFASHPSILPPRAPMPRSSP